MNVFESVAMRNTLALVILVFFVLTVAVIVSVLFLRKPDTQNKSRQDESNTDVGNLKMSASKEDKL